MPIPSGRVEPAPPPALPPPRFIEDLDVGRDPGWAWGNTVAGGRGTGAVAAHSSLRGYWERAEGRQDHRRGSSTSTVRSPADETDGRGRDEGYHSLSGSSLAYQSVPSFRRGRGRGGEGGRDGGGRRPRRQHGPC
jgi:hypothetical protein